MAAKKQNEEEKKPSTAVAVASFGGELATDADLGKELEGLTGLGYSEKQEDGLVPILSILQDNSGEVKKGHSRRIEGAEAGWLIIRSIGKVIDLSQGLPPVQPCGFAHVWVAWMGEPGDGKPVGRYPFDDRPAEAKLTKVPRDDGGEGEVWMMPDGSRLVDTREHYVHMFLDGAWRPLVIPMAGTNHTVSRGWTEQMKAFRLPGGAKCPAWFRAYSLNAKFNQRGQQSWYTYELKDLGWITDAEQRAAGRKMFEATEAQTIAPELDSEDQTSGGSQKDDSTIPV